MIAIIDYGAGNLMSVQKAFAYIGFDAKITGDAQVIKDASHVVLPGVGSFGDAMEKLNAAGLYDTIREVIKNGTPFLGVCLGLQLLFTKSEEANDIRGLDIFVGTSVKIPKVEGLKIPHIGWNNIKFNEKCPLFSGLTGEPYVYFVHSYYVKPEDKNIVAATTNYACELFVSFWYKNVFLVQFHPEKSSDVGLTMLKNFANLKKGDEVLCTQNG